MTELALARVVHVLAVVLWIGGVAMVTWVLIPNVLRDNGSAAQFEAFERRFATQSRFTVLLAGVSGFYMVGKLDLWPRFAEPRFWWMHAMVAVWVVFSLMLYVLEPLWLHRWFDRRVATNPMATMRLIQRMHRVLLTLSLVTIAGAVAGSHGFL